MIYVVLTPGRTGSNLKACLIKDYYRQQSLIYKIYHDSKRDIIVSENSNIIFHTHNKHFLKDRNLDPSWVTLVISKRDSIFDAILSNEIAQHTNEFLKYSNKTIIPFAVNEQQFVQELNKHNSWYDDIDLTLPFKNIITLTYEESLEISNFSNKMRFKQFNTIVYKFVPKSPYSYKDIISNWQDLKSKFINL